MSTGVLINNGCKPLTLVVAAANVNPPLVTSAESSTLPAAAIAVRSDATVLFALMAAARRLATVVRTWLAVAVPPLPLPFTVRSLAVTV